ncbi:type II secretion system F family protein [Nesterenkonia flava]|uniref:Type II secretion system F family protein n=1 Tax=Nesterenkonia flava TaxID=469799 RepID=A0ABU1FUX6_9MICC|nr:type II secretion system F family protein [Nesterenkonia flava]MDR5712305.1 type II secretion system F family protein [Nesterenkonia flava]
MSFATIAAVGTAGLFSTALALLLLPAPVGQVLPTRRRNGVTRGSASHADEDESSRADAATLLDLTAALLNAGVGIEAALDRLSRSVPGAGPLGAAHQALASGASWKRATAMVQERAELRTFCHHLSFAYETGAPSAEMLQAAASQARAERRHAAERAAAELGVKMMLPLGACFLPAFILLGVLPVVISMLPAALGG